MPASDRLRVALGQFFVQASSSGNLAITRRLVERSAAAGAGLLVLPEGVIARKPEDPAWSRRKSEPLDGPYVRGLLRATEGSDLTVVCTVQARVPGQTRYANDLLVVRDGKLLLVYQKLHLYDAFGARESDNAIPGDAVPGLLYIGPFRAGFMTCYDARFPELARALAIAGADLLVVPAAWVRGPLKEMQWDLSLRARALENTCYVVGVSECGPAHIGCSKVVDPFGVVTAQCGTSDQLLFAELDLEFVRQCRVTLPVLDNRRFAAPTLR